MDERTSRTMHISADGNTLNVSFSWFDRTSDEKVTSQWKHAEKANVTVLESVRKLFNKLDSRFYVACMDEERLSLIYDIPALLEPWFDEAVQSEAPLAVFGSLFDTKFIKH